MKKFLLIISIGMLGVSCGTKESSRSSSSIDSTAVDTTKQKVAPSTIDTTTTRMTNPDSIRMKIDSAIAPVK